MTNRVEIENGTQRKITILIAEDDDGHAELIQEHLQDAGISNPIIRFVNGQECWNFLSCSGPGLHREDKTPYLLLLDIRMPKMDGVEVLRRVKADKSLHAMPVIMLTTTNDPREVREGYELGCNSYVTKPINYLHFAEALKRLGLFIMIIQVAAVNGQS
jgi:CheY-like chemotaxis protein